MRTLPAAPAQLLLLFLLLTLLCEEIEIGTAQSHESSTGGARSSAATRDAATGTATPICDRETRQKYPLHRAAILLNVADLRAYSAAKAQIDKLKDKQDHLDREDDGRYNAQKRDQYNELTRYYYPNQQQSAEYVWGCANGIPYGLHTMVRDEQLARLKICMCSFLRRRLSRADALFFECELENQVNDDLGEFPKPQSTTPKKDLFEETSNAKTSVPVADTTTETNPQKTEPTPEPPAPPVLTLPGGTNSESLSPSSTDNSKDPVAATDTPSREIKIVESAASSSSDEDRTNSLFWVLVSCVMILILGLLLMLLRNHIRPRSPRFFL